MVNHFFPGTRLRVPATFRATFASQRRDKRLRYLPWTLKTSRERAIDRPATLSRDLMRPWCPRASGAALYLIESGLRLLVDTTGPSTHVMGLLGGRQRIEWLDGVLGRSPMSAGRERAAVAFGSRSVQGGSHCPPSLCRHLWQVPHVLASVPPHVSTRDACM